MEVRYKATILKAQMKEGVMRMIVEIDKMDIEKVRRFGQKKADYEKEKKLDRQPVSIQMKYWLQQHSPGQKGLYTMLVDRIAQADTVSPAMVRRAIEEVAAPRDSYKDRLIVKDIERWDTREMARVIEYAKTYAYEAGADISDIWVLWHDERAKEDVDPVEGIYKNEEEYREAHPFCEFCGRPLVETTSAGGARQREGQLIHFVPTKPDDLWNRAMACTKCHMQTQHSVGFGELLATFKHMRHRVESAWKRCGHGVVPAGYGRGEKSKITDEETKILDDAENSEHGLFG